MRRRQWWPWLDARVSGSSMLPTLADGDRLLMRRVRSGAEVHAGEIVLVEHPQQPGVVLVKRAVRRAPDGWWVEGDNTAASDDSRAFGSVADRLVLARAVGGSRPTRRRAHRR